MPGARITHHQLCRDVPHDSTAIHTACAPCAFPLPHEPDYSLPPEETQSTQVPHATPRTQRDRSIGVSGCHVELVKHDKGFKQECACDEHWNSENVECQPASRDCRTCCACVHAPLRARDMCRMCGGRHAREREHHRWLGVCNGMHVCTATTGGSAGTASVSSRTPPRTFSLWPPHHVYKSQLPHLEPPEPCSRPCSRL